MPSAEERQADIDKWMTRMTTMEISYPNLIGFQGDYLTDLNDNTDYPKIDTAHMLELFLSWIKNKQADIMTFRDK
jgi:trimethylamine monooxygenase